MLMDYSKHLHTTFDCIIGNTIISCVLDTGFFYNDIMTYEPHIHLSYELHVISSGSYAIETLHDDEFFELKVPQVLIIPPNCYHNTKKDHDSPRKYSMRFTLSRTKEIPEHSYDCIYDDLLGCLPAPYSIPMCILIDGAAELSENIRDELISGKIGSIETARAELCRLWVRIIRLLLDDTQKTGQSMSDNSLYSNDSISARLHKIQLFIGSNYQNPITEAILAENLNLSVRQVSRIFSEHYGKTFREILTEVRMHHAEKLLARTDATVESIAYRVGYASPSAFFCMFRKQHSVTPIEYRQKIRNH